MGALKVTLIHDASQEKIALGLAIASTQPWDAAYTGLNARCVVEGIQDVVRCRT